MNIAAASSISAVVSPVAASTASQSSDRTCSAHASKPVVCRSMKSRSATAPGLPAAAAASSAVTSRWPRAWNSARSPLTRICR